MATIRKRVNETTIKYQARVRVSNHPTITKTFNLRSHAIQWARETEIQIEKGGLNSGYKPTKETLGDALERYLKEITPRKKSSDREESRINNLIKDPIASGHNI